MRIIVLVVVRVLVLVGVRIYIFNEVSWDRRFFFFLVVFGGLKVGLENVRFLGWFRSREFVNGFEVIVKRIGCVFEDIVEIIFGV